MQNIKFKESLEPTINFLEMTYGLVPMITGVDKFTNALTDWEQYVNADLFSMLPFEIHTFMLIIGVIEILAGFIVLVRPLIGGYIVASWLTLIAITLLAGGKHNDVAVSYIVMAIGAFSMSRLEVVYIAICSNLQKKHIYKRKFYI